MEDMNEQIADWAILVYISADRTLANFAVESLKQLKRGAGDGIIVLAQQASGRQKAQRYVFDQVSKPSKATNLNPSIAENLQDGIDPEPTPGGIADPKNLTEFIKWSSQQYPAKHRCLFLWGHGYELLLNEDLPSNGTPSAGDKAETTGKKPGRKYLAPKNLKKALEEAKQFAGELDIIGIDACSLSIIELASELTGCGKFMIASQEEVPDTSFPYEQLLLNIRQSGNRDDVEGISAAIPRLYAESYQDYVVAPDSGMREITLTSLRLKNIAEITEPLKGLAAALESSTFDAERRKTILKAREESRDFALGLFVDLHDFCARLSQKLAECPLKSACDAVVEAMDARGVILKNATRDAEKAACHGLSIYLPYLTDKQMELAMLAGSGDVPPLLLKGGTNHLQKGGTNHLEKGGTNHLEKARGAQISEIEEDFEQLEQFKKTNWKEFIKRGWSVMLAAEEPDKLGQHYSAQQCAINLYSVLSESQVPQKAAAAIP
jgi:hypothetical protein